MRSEYFVIFWILQLAAVWPHRLKKWLIFCHWKQPKFWSKGKLVRLQIVKITIIWATLFIKGSSDFTCLTFVSSAFSCKLRTSINERVYHAMVSDTFLNMFTQGHSPQSLGPDPLRRKWSFVKNSIGYLERTWTVSATLNDIMTIVLQ